MLWITKGVFLVKRIFAMILALVTLFAFVSCDKKTEEDKGEKEVFDIFEQADSIIETNSIEGGFLYLSNAEKEEERLDPDLIRSLYADVASVPDFEQVEEYAVYIGNSSVKPCEFGLFKMTDDADVEQFMLYLQARIDDRIQHAKSYPEIDDEAWTTSVVETKNGYVWYLAIKGANSSINSEIKEKV